MKKLFTKISLIALLAILSAGNVTAQEFYTITISANPQHCGMVVGGGILPHGYQMTVMAFHVTECTFVNWTEDGVEVSTEPLYTFIVERDRNLVANFVPIIYYNLTLISNPAAGGTVIGQGTYAQGTDVVITATPNLPYFEFINWTENGVVVSTNPELTLTVNEDRVLAANFGITTAPFEITVSANPAEYGAVTGGGSFNYGADVTVSAVANANFQFLNWTENGAVVSTAANYTFMVQGARNLVANFVPSTVEITLSANPPDGGTLSGAGVYPYGTLVGVKVNNGSIPPDYDFKNWTENGNIISSNHIITFHATQSRHLIANFIPAFYEIPVYANPYEGGIVTGGGVYTYGTNVTITAAANEGYQFLNWTKFHLGNGTVVSTEPVYSYQIVGDGWGNTAFMAYFKQGAKVTVMVNMPGGEVLGGGIYELGDEVTVEAIPAQGYKFVNWSRGREVLSTDNPYRFTVTEDLVLVANFAEDGSVAIDPIDAGAVMIYPNPTSSDITVVLNDATLKIVDIELYDLTGKKVHQQTVNQPLATLQMSGLAAGVYVLKVFLNQGEPVVWRVVKN